MLVSIITRYTGVLRVYLEFQMSFIAICNSDKLVSIRKKYLLHAT